MPSNGIAKTKSALKRSIWVVLLGVFVLLFCYLLFASARQKPTVTGDFNGKKYTLTIGGAHAAEQQNQSPQPHGRTYYLTSAHTESAQERGLSGTAGLAHDQGMLFWYDHVGERCFWMKDMRYSLDIVWLNSQKKIVHIEKNLSPDTYPKAYCADAQYALELAAGEADKSALTTGQVLSF
jgi:uncharacterized membrane protein (UPF0127 family)